jgi:predicted phage terminase large subunit-like protein
MLSQAKQLLRTDFETFIRKAFRHDHDGKKLGEAPYIDYLCHELERVASGVTRRLLINLPPRHLKTFLAGIYLAAWVLAKEPSTRVMVITYSEQLAKHITYQIRRVMTSSWFQEAFKTRVARDRSQVNDFATTKGGGVFATSVGGGLAGRGADLIIFDDPLDLKDAGNVKQIERVNQMFDNLIMSRLNDPKVGRVVIIAHRLNDNDLSAHVMGQRDWRSVVLPLIATRKKTYDLGYGTWKRKRGEFLRSDSFTSSDVKRLRNTINPDFGLFYQQGIESAARMSIKAEHFGAFEPNEIGRLPIILSIDPSHRGGVGGSHCVIQAWSPSQGDHLLLDQWREQCGYETLRHKYLWFVRHFRPSVALIEATANGPALIDAVGRRSTPKVVPVTPDGRSKTARLLAHVRLIRKSHILLPTAAGWRVDYVKELVDFPSAPFDDQVDATTQYLVWIAKNPVPALPPDRATIAVANHMSPMSTGGNVINSAPGIVVIKGRRPW